MDHGNDCVQPDYNGWHCPDCGRFVPQGEYHVCGTEKLATTVYNTVAGPDMQRIAAALERIAVALERMGDNDGN